MGRERPTARKEVCPDHEGKSITKSGFAPPEGWKSAPTAQEDLRLTNSPVTPSISASLPEE